MNLFAHALVSYAIGVKLGGPVWAALLFGMLRTILKRTIAAVANILLKNPRFIDSRDYGHAR